jgi:large subunit ribosomal protein L3
MLHRSTRLFGKIACRPNFVLSSITSHRNYVKTRKIDLTMQDPRDLIDEWKRRMENVPRLSEVDEGDQVVVWSRIFDEQIKLYEDDIKNGVIPAKEGLEEEPGIQPYIDFLSRKRPEPGEYNDGVTRRCGAIGVKIGMTRFWDSYWQEVPLTIIYIPQCQVIQVKQPHKDGLIPLQLGAIPIEPRKVTKPLLGHFMKAGVPPKRALCEFKVTPDAVLPVGHEIKARHFVPGQFVDVTGMTKGKGFQGPMKRWGFGGQPASHGVSVTHRSHGSTGNRIGKVFKGKKMAGRMGGDQRTQLALTVFMVNPVHNIIYVKGSVPATKDGVVLIRDARLRKQEIDLPMPTFIEDPNEDLTTGKFTDHLLRYSGKKPFNWVTQEYTEETARKIEKKIWEMKYGTNKTPWDMPIVPRQEPLEEKKVKK